MTDFDAKSDEIVARDHLRDAIAAALKAAYNKGVEDALTEARDWFRPEAGNHPAIMVRAKKVPT